MSRMKLRRGLRKTLQEHLTSDQVRALAWDLEISWPNDISYLDRNNDAIQFILTNLERRRNIEVISMFFEILAEEHTSINWSAFNYFELDTDQNQSATSSISTQGHNNTIAQGDGNILVGAGGVQNTYIHGNESPLLRTFEIPELPDHKDLLPRVEKSNLIDQISKNSGIWVIHGLTGVGKSSLAIDIAKELISPFNEKVYWVKLIGAVETDGKIKQSEMIDILKDFAKNLEMGELRGDDLADITRHFRQRLPDKRLLIVLDNAHNWDLIKPFLPSSTSSISTLITTQNSKILERIIENEEEGREFHGTKELLNLKSFTREEGLAFFKNSLKKKHATKEIQCAKDIIDEVGGHPLALSIVCNRLKTISNLTLSETRAELKDPADCLRWLEDRDSKTRSVLYTFGLTFNKISDQTTEMFARMGQFPFSDVLAVDTPEMVTRITKSQDLSSAKVKKGIEELTRYSIIDQEDQPAPAHPKLSFHKLVHTYAHHLHSTKIGAQPIN